MLKVLWSDHLENLAEGLFRTWEETSVRDPFARTCVVVGDAATQNWLQSFFLLHHRPGHRRVLSCRFPVDATSNRRISSMMKTAD